MDHISQISLSGDPTTLLIALGGGMVPALLWLWFWLREDRENPEPSGLLFMTFIVGMLSVILVLPVEKWVATLAVSDTMHTILWAASEEILKFLVVLAVVFRSPYLDEPVDFAIYFMTAALGFAALENGLFLIHPVTVNDTVVSLLTGNLRFFGATLLHAAASGIIGIFLGLAFFKSGFAKKIYGIFGIAAAISLHSVFNLFIMGYTGKSFLGIFAFLWVVCIIIMLLYEKLRRMAEYITA